MTEDEAGLVKQVDATDYRTLIIGASKILDTVTLAWKSSFIALVGSLGGMGIVAMLLYFTILPKDPLFIDGLIFLGFAAYILFRYLTGGCCVCCTEEIPQWRRRIASLIKQDSTVDLNKDGEGILEVVLGIILASIGWMNSIRRDLLSMLVWPALAAIVLIFSVLAVDSLTFRIVWVVFIAIVFVEIIAIYYGVKARFRGWLERAAFFREQSRKMLEVG